MDLEKHLVRESASLYVEAERAERASDIKTSEEVLRTELKAGLCVPIGSSLVKLPKN